MGNTETKSSNQRMVDSLVTDHGYQEFERPHIRTAQVEGAFRAVDRAMYYEFDKEELIDPYTDEPWRRGNLHISAPCIYARVVEALNLKPGLSFLNLGSGTGYLNTIVGLLIGPNGVNHGIELHQDVVDYAYKRLERFKNETVALAKYDFVEPIFIRGNCLKINPNSRYDRIYLGAACLPELAEFIKKLLKPNGAILVMPHEDHLMRYIRMDEQEWLEEKLMRVSFTLMIRQGEDDATIDMPLPSAKSLKELCRDSIRQLLRNKINKRHPKLLNSDNLESRRKREAAAEMYESARALGEANALFRSMGFRPRPFNNLMTERGGREVGDRSGRRSTHHKELQRRLRASRRERGHTCGCCHVRAQTSGRHTVNESAQRQSIQPDQAPSTGFLRCRVPTASSNSSSHILTRSASRRLIEQQQQPRPRQQSSSGHNNQDSSSSDDDNREEQEANPDDSSDDDHDAVIGQQQAAGNCARTRPIVLRRDSSGGRLRPRCLHSSLSQVYNSSSPFGLAAVTNRRLLTTASTRSSSLIPAYHRRRMARLFDATLSQSSSSSSSSSSASSSSSSSASPPSSRASPTIEELEYIRGHGRGRSGRVVLNWPGFLSIGASGHNNNEPPTLNLAHCARLLPNHSPLSTSSSSSSSSSESSDSSDEDEEDSSDGEIPDLSLPDAAAAGSSTGADTPVWHNQVDYEDSLSCPFSDGNDESYSSDSLCDLSSAFHSQQSDLEGGDKDAAANHNVGNCGEAEISLGPVSSSATLPLGAGNSSLAPHNNRLQANDSTNNEPVARRLRSKRPADCRVSDGCGQVGTSGATSNDNNNNNNNNGLMDRLLASSSRAEDKRRHQHRHRHSHRLEGLIPAESLGSHRHHCHRHRHRHSTRASTSTLEQRASTRGSETATIGNHSSGNGSSSNQDMFAGHVLIATALGTNILSMSERRRYLPAAATSTPASIETRRCSLRPRSSALVSPATTSTGTNTATTTRCHNCQRHSSSGGQLEDGRKRKRHRSSSSDSSSWSHEATTATGRRRATQGAPSDSDNNHRRRHRRTAADKPQFNSGDHLGLTTDRRTPGKTRSGTVARLSRCGPDSSVPAAVSGGREEAANEWPHRCGAYSWRLNLIDTSSSEESPDDEILRQQMETATLARERRGEVEPQMARVSERCRYRRRQLDERRRRVRRQSRRRSVENECQRYHRFMSGYIRHLDLPRSLHSYLNHDRDYQALP